METKKAQERIERERRERLLFFYGDAVRRRKEELEKVVKMYKGRVTEIDAQLDRDDLLERERRRLHGNRGANQRALADTLRQIQQCEREIASYQ
jgi:hypothetical protein